MTIKFNSEKKEVMKEKIMNPNWVCPYNGKKCICEEFINGEDTLCKGGLYIKDKD